MTGRKSPVVPTTPRVASSSFHSARTGTGTPRRITLPRSARPTSGATSSSSRWFTEVSQADFRSAEKIIRRMSGCRISHAASVPRMLPITGRGGPDGDAAACTHAGTHVRKKPWKRSKRTRVPRSRTNARKKNCASARTASK